MRAYKRLHADSFSVIRRMKQARAIEMKQAFDDNVQAREIEKK
jgi:hypothetical protein